MYRRRGVSGVSVGVSGGAFAVRLRVHGPVGARILGQSKRYAGGLYRPDELEESSLIEITVRTKTSIETLTPIPTSSTDGRTSIG